VVPLKLVACESLFSMFYFVGVYFSLGVYVRLGSILILLLGMSMMFLELFQRFLCEEDFLLRLGWILMITNTHHKRRKAMEAQHGDKDKR